MSIAVLLQAAEYLERVERGNDFIKNLNLEDYNFFSKK
jgi:hypothetical protein